jgi:hypothetical protein
MYRRIGEWIGITAMLSRDWPRMEPCSSSTPILNTLAYGVGVREEDPHGLGAQHRHRDSLLGLFGRERPAQRHVQVPDLEDFRRGGNEDDVLHAPASRPLDLAAPVVQDADAHGEGEPFAEVLGVLELDGRTAGPGTTLLVAGVDLDVGAAERDGVEAEDLLREVLFDVLVQALDDADHDDEEHHPYHDAQDAEEALQLLAVDLAEGQPDPLPDVHGSDPLPHQYSGPPALPSALDSASLTASPSLRFRIRW